MTRIDLTALRTLAQSATPGPWAIEPHPFGNSPARSIHVADRDPDEFPVVTQLGCGCCDVGLDADAEDLSYIAGANPATVLRLLDALEAVLELHRPTEVDALNTDCSIEECDCEGDCTTEPVTVCAHCFGVGEESHPYAYEQGGIETVRYPCPTVAALHAALIGADDD